MGQIRRRGRLTPERIAELTAAGALDPKTSNWMPYCREGEWSQVYTLRARAERRASDRERPARKRNIGKPVITIDRDDREGA